MDTNSQSSVWKHVTIDCKQLPCEIHNKRMDLVCEKVQKDATKGSRYSETQSNCWKRLPIGQGADWELVQLPLKEENKPSTVFSENAKKVKQQSTRIFVLVKFKINLPWVPGLERADKACWLLRCRPGRCSCPPRGCWTAALHLLSTLGGLRSDSQCVVCPALKI